MSREKRVEDKEKKNVKSDVLRDQSQFYYKKVSEVGKRDLIKQKRVIKRK